MIVFCRDTLNCTMESFRGQAGGRNNVGEWLMCIRRYLSEVGEDGVSDTTSHLYYDFN